MSKYRHILYEKQDMIARVKLNRPQYFNAQTELMLDEMDDAFQSAVDDEDVRVIILSGKEIISVPAMIWGHLRSKRIRPRATILRVFPVFISDLKGFILSMDYGGATSPSQRSLWFMVIVSSGVG